jgi:hypothetical protein
MSLADSRGFIVKPDRDTDFYVVWSNIVEAPLGTGSRADLLGEGFPEDRIHRADVTGTSMMRDLMSTYWGVLDGEWEDEGFIAEQRGVLPRARLAAYAKAYMDERWDDCWDLLVPFEDEAEVRRG